MEALDRNNLKKTFGYYKASDVDRFLDAAQEALEAGNRQMEDRSSELKQKLEEQLAEIRNLNRQLEERRMEVENIRTELEIANSQTTILSNRVARQQKELEERERLLQLDPVGEANDKAEKIVQNAMKISRQMLDDAENVRTRAFAAVRSAYFNTMDFRREVEGKFIQLEHDLDRSVGALRTIDVQDPGPDFTPNFVPDYVPEEVS